MLHTVTFEHLLFMLLMAEMLSLLQRDLQKMLCLSASGKGNAFVSPAGCKAALVYEVCL